MESMPSFLLRGDQHLYVLKMKILIIYSQRVQIFVLRCDDIVT